ncbi:MAG: hypothetical protein PHV78_03840 [Patescibacteria group bacterium]|nr:hypothetical protein [Patescibacteria group bacterium]MDD5121482.1 hypothetical protein [Patescibacteria group bacterium]MDD5221954.1 hypothetical protein [Patescibacteria group bacterium]MDD5396356.1 hypothetical protein [Patescibacteria group bacterium]
MKKRIIWIIIVIVFAILLLLATKFIVNYQPNNPAYKIPSDWLTYLDNINGTTFRYPATFGANVWRAQSWPPKLTIVQSSQDALKIGCPELPTGSVEQDVTINKISYQFWKGSDAGAGSLYNTYCYVAQKHQKFYVLYFVVWSHLGCGDGSCGAYCETQFETECRNLDRTITINQPIELMVSSLKIK